MVGFNMRVTERAGTTLGSMLSNKNVGSKLECGRVECRVCYQADDKRQDCVRRNILYESECVKCVPSEERNDLSLERKEAHASLYVGESARSLFERSTEHWKAALLEKEESHMHQHMMEVHREEVAKPDFKFKVVKTFKSALDRQVTEAVRIEMRGSILNRKGEFNRCSLTRLGVDLKWEDERYRKSLECVRIENNEEIPFMLESQKMRREGHDQLQERGAKRRKRENGGVVWGEKVDADQRRKNQFLGSEESTTT